MSGQQKERGEEKSNISAKRKRNSKENKNNNAKPSFIKNNNRIDQVNGDIICKLKINLVKGKKIEFKISNSIQHATN